MTLCLLILDCSRQKEEEKPTGAATKKVAVQAKITPKSSVKEAKNTKAGKVTAREATVARGQYAGKGMPEDASSKEKSRTIAEETPKVLDPAESVIRTDLSEEERRAAVKALANMDHATILEVVMKALDSPSPDVRKAVLEALAEVDDEAVNVPLLKAMEDENIEVREEAMQVMDELESPNILPSLELALFDSDEDIREEALSILEDIPNHGAVDILIEKGLQHEDESIREDTLVSLEFITDQRFASYEQAREWWDRNRDEFVFPEVWRIRKNW
jgi:HEAT repeat protein